MSTWHENTGHLRMGFCATEGCKGRSTWQLQAGDVWSDYCTDCRHRIEAWQEDEQNRMLHEEQMRELERQAMEEHFARHPHG